MFYLYHNESYDILIMESSLDYMSIIGSRVNNHTIAC